MLPVLIQNTLDDKDRNKDGFIDFEEFIGGEGMVSEIYGFGSALDSLFKIMLNFRENER